LAAGFCLKNLAIPRKILRCPTQRSTTPSVPFLRLVCLVIISSW